MYRWTRVYYKKEEQFLRALSMLTMKNIISPNKCFQAFSCVIRFLAQIAWQKQKATSADRHRKGRIISGLYRYSNRIIREPNANECSSVTIYIELRCKVNNWNILIVSLAFSSLVIIWQGRGYGLYVQSCSHEWFR